MSFKQNLLQKIEVARLASKVLASIGTRPAQHPIDKEAMRRLLELSPYQYQQERDLDLYVKPDEGELKKILVLDNELPIFRSTVKDVVTRRSPLTLELWSLRTVRHILVDSDIKISTREESVATVLEDAVAQLDLTYTDQDIRALAQEGMGWLASGHADGVEETLTLFAALLGYRKPPEYFGLDQTISYGITAAEPGKDKRFGPLVLYRPADNTLAYINESVSPSNPQQIEFLRAVAAGEATVALTGDAVFAKLQADVLENNPSTPNSG